LCAKWRRKERNEKKLFGGKIFPPDENFPSLFSSSGFETRQAESCCYLKEITCTSDPAVFISTKMVSSSSPSFFFSTVALFCLHYHEGKGAVLIFVVARHELNAILSFPDLCGGGRQFSRSCVRQQSG
jgi:hypothetical protein